MMFFGLRVDLAACRQVVVRSINQRAYTHEANLV